MLVNARQLRACNVGLYNTVTSDLISARRGKRGVRMRVFSEGCESWGVQGVVDRRHISLIGSRSRLYNINIQSLYISSVYSPFSDRVGLSPHNTPFPGVLMSYDAFLSFQLEQYLICGTFEC